MENNINKNPIPTSEESFIEKRETRWSKGNIFSIIIVFILILAVAVFISIQSNKKIKKDDQIQYASVNFPGLPKTYTLGKDFQIQNELIIEPASENYYYSSTKISYISEVGKIASNLAMTGPQSNTSTNIHIWKKNNDNANAILYKGYSNELEIKYKDGVNFNSTEDAAYENIKSFTNLKLLPGHVATKLDVNNGYLYSFDAKFNDRDIFIRDNNKNIGSIKVLNNKLVSANINLVEENHQKSNQQLRPINKINASNLSSLNYFITLNSNSSSSGSPYGAEQNFKGPASVALRDYKNVYQYVLDINTGNSYIVPAIEINGDYRDSSNGEGQIKMLVLNQAPLNQ